MTASSAVSDSTTAAGRITTPLGRGGAGAKIIENFDICVAAAGGVDQIRRLILDLAVRGRLLVPDPTLPPPASDGLERGVAWKTKL
jgi:hypothetical protein